MKPEDEFTLLLHNVIISGIASRVRHGRSLTKKQEEFMVHHGLSWYIHPLYMWGLKKVGAS